MGTPVRPQSAPDPGGGGSPLSPHLLQGGGLSRDLMEPETGTGVTRSLTWTWS